MQGIRSYDYESKFYIMFFFRVQTMNIINLRWSVWGDLDFSAAKKKERIKNDDQNYACILGDQKSRHHGGLIEGLT